MKTETTLSIDELRATLDSTNREIAQAEKDLAAAEHEYRKSAINPGGRCPFERTRLAEALPPLGDKINRLREQSRGLLRDLKIAKLTSGPQPAA